MRILNNSDLDGLLPRHEIISAVEQAMLDYEAKDALVPKRMHIDHDRNTLLCMPSWNQHFFGTKLVAVFPGNKSLNLPVTNGAMILNDSKTGSPLALMNAAKLTALRTGALGAIGVKLLTPADTTTLGLVGTGVQGLHQALFACSVRPIDNLFFLKRSYEQSENLKAFLIANGVNVKVTACQSAEELLGKTDVVIVATTSPTPVLPNDAHMLRQKHFIGIGSYKPSMQELPDNVYKLAGELYIDSDFARHETGDIINPIKNGMINQEDVFTIGKLLSQERKVDVQNTTVYKSAGMALFDLYVAQMMYKKAIAHNVGIEIEF